MAEQAGFEALWISDHFHPWVDDTSAAGFVWSWLGMVAARTDRVQLGTCVTCPLFHYQPGLVAQMTATVDRLSGGRMLLGLGTGEAINERSLGFPFPGYGERYAPPAETEAPRVLAWISVVNVEVDPRASLVRAHTRNLRQGRRDRH